MPSLKIFKNKSVFNFLLKQTEYKNPIEQIPILN